MIQAWVNDVNSTSLRIIVSIALAVFMIVALTSAMLFVGWSPTPGQKWVLYGIAGGILTMMGFDVIQFASKRFSDAGYAAAKNPSPVTVEAARTVTVTSEPVEPAPRVAPAPGEVAASPAPAPPVAPTTDDAAEIQAALEHGAARQRGE